MQQRTEELEMFKTCIDLTEYAASRGYALDRKASSRSSVVMEHTNGDKVIVAKDTDGHWIYFSVRDDTDHGTVIDFVQRRDGGNLGDVRKTLRAFIGRLPLPHPSSYCPPALEPATKDLVRVRARLEAMDLIQGHHTYLEELRKIPAEVFALPRFADRIRTDHYGNAIFPHWSVSGLCGYEIKNQYFTGFAPGGEKGLWISRSEPGDSALVITETAIDALSHFTLMRPEFTRYASTAGTLNTRQPELIRQAAEKLGPSARVILATDNDEGGDRLALAIREALAASAVNILYQRPEARGLDWNDVLRNCELLSHSKL